MLWLDFFPCQPPDCSDLQSVLHLNAPDSIRLLILSFWSGSVLLQPCAEICIYISHYTWLKGTSDIELHTENGVRNIGEWFGKKVVKSLGADLLLEDNVHSHLPTWRRFVLVIAAELTDDELEISVTQDLENFKSVISLLFQRWSSSAVNVVCIEKFSVKHLNNNTVQYNSMFLFPVTGVMFKPDASIRVWGSRRLLVWKLTTC